MSVKDLKKEIVQEPKKMGLLVGNPVYKPFRYPWCYDAWLTQSRTSSPKGTSSGNQ